MDMSLVSAIVAMQAGGVQSQVAASVLKSSLDSQKSTVLTLLGFSQQDMSLTNVGPGIGGNLNISA